MKVGDYVRTNKGSITKIKWIIEEKGTLGKTISGKYQCEDYDIYTYPDEFKSSPNIIDLIEVGDYVNGTIVTKVVLDNIECNYIELDYSYNKRGIRNKDIKSIVTKEQFESMEYKIGE